MRSLIRFLYQSSEALFRRLADYCVYLRDYRNAYSVYDTAKKEYSVEKAWNYYAGAQVSRVSVLFVSANVVANI